MGTATQPKKGSAPQLTDVIFFCLAVHGGAFISLSFWGWLHASVALSIHLYWEKADPA